MTTSFGHQILASRHRYQGTLELLSPLRLSSGRASDTTDAPLMRDRQGRPYIPGSSLRGALRSEIERILAGVGAASGLWCCTLFEQDDGPGACITASRAKQKTFSELEENARRRGASREVQAAPLAFLEEKLCDVCKLFGSPFYASRLVIEDALPLPDAKLATVVRDGVGIDRDTGAARENVKFDFEVLETGASFALCLRVENLTEKDRKLLDLLFALLRQGIFAGGKRAAGLGCLRLREKSLQVWGFESPEELWQALEQGQPVERRLDGKEVADAQAPSL
jgi:CRISPR-associated protein Csm3